MTVLQVPMQQKRGTTALWTASSYVLKAGEIGVEYTDLGEMAGFKIGDGVALWDALPYASSTTLAALIATIALGSSEDAIDLLSAIAVKANILLFAQLFDEEDEEWSPVDEDQFILTSSATPLAPNFYPIKRVPGEDWVEVADSISGTDSIGNPTSRTFAETNAALDGAKTLLSLTPSGSFSIALTGNHRAIKVNPTANATITSISGLAEGQDMLLRFTQNAGGTLTFTKPGGWLAPTDALVGGAGNGLLVNTGASAVTDFIVSGMASSGVKIRRVPS